VRALSVQQLDDRLSSGAPRWRFGEIGNDQVHFFAAAFFSRRKFSEVLAFRGENRL
jgi:hypothetical protein